LVRRVRSGSRRVGLDSPPVGRALVQPLNSRAAPQHAGQAHPGSAAVPLIVQPFSARPIINS
jgi:hypothetical protein